MFNFQFPGSEMPKINAILKIGANITEEKFILQEIERFLSSPQRQNMIRGINYYNGKHDILMRKRESIGSDGELEPVHNIPNNRIVNNQYKKMVDQKANYLCGKPMTFTALDKGTVDLINIALGEKFNKTIKDITIDALNCGLAYIYCCYSADGELELKRLNPLEIIPGWADEEHTKLDYVIRVYDVIEIVGRNTEVVRKVEYYTKDSVKKYTYKRGKLFFESNTPYFTRGDVSYSWDEIPITPFKYNNERSLLNNVKTLQDSLNLMFSNFQNSTEEDIRNTILVLKNYDGENLGEFRHNLATYGAVKVSDGGGVDTLTVNVNSDNYKTIIDLLKKAIIENAMGYDAKDDRLGGNANQMNIQSMYSDIDLDANGMELDFKVSIKRLLYFVRLHILNTKHINIDNNVDIIFNRDILINESEVIENCVKSQGILSEETIVAQHPWTVDVSQEMEKLNRERKKEFVYDISLGDGVHE